MTTRVSPAVSAGRRSRVVSSLHSRGALSRHCVACLGASEIRSAADDLVQVGIIGGTHGVRGEIRVQPTSDFAAERLQTPGTKWIQPTGRGLMNLQQGPLKQVESLGGRPHVYKGHNLWILRFKGITNPEEAAPLKGARMMVPPEERHELPEDEYYIQQLIGMRVIQQDNGEIWGQVESVFPGKGAPDILIIKQYSNLEEKPVLLPFVHAFVPVVDLQRNEIEITPPEDVIRKFIRAGMHLGHSVNADAAVRRDYLQNLEQIARSRYETLFAVRQCFRRRQPFCIVEEDKKDAALSRRMANIILAYKTIKVLR